EAGTMEKGVRSLQTNAEFYIDCQCTDAMPWLSRRPGATDINPSFIFSRTARLEFSSGTEGEHIGAHPDIARGQGQYVPSLWAAAADTAHPASTEPPAPVAPHAPSALVADGLPIEQPGARGTP